MCSGSSGRAPSGIPARTGKECRHGIKDGREVWLGVECVRDVAGHPTLMAVARSGASLTVGSGRRND